MRVLTTGQTAKALQVSIDTVIRLIKSGDIKAERLTPTSQYRIKEADLIEYAEERKIDLLPLSK